MKPKHKKLYMDLAERISEESYAERLKVGCVIVKNDNILSFSWNGTPPDYDNVCEDENYVTKPEVLHAEENAVGKLAKESGGANGAIAFITHQPCINCSRLMYKAGIKHVYYSYKYRDDTGINFLLKCGVAVEQI